VGYYEVAQVCLDGHMITNRYNRNLELRKRFCDKCGAETIHQCRSCNTPIQGKYIVEGAVVLGSGPGSPPSYCHNCGKSYPWTERRLETARYLIEEADELNEEKEELVSSLPDLVNDTPRTASAAARLRKALSKVGEHTALALKEIFIEIASETAKKLLFPGI